MADETSSRARLLHFDMLSGNTAEMSLTLAPLDFLLVGVVCLGAGVALGVVLGRYLRGRARAAGELDATPGAAPLPPAKAATAMTTRADGAE